MPCAVSSLLVGSEARALASAPPSVAAPASVAEAHLPELSVLSGAAVLGAKQQTYGTDSECIT